MNKKPHTNTLKSCLYPTLQQYSDNDDLLLLLFSDGGKVPLRLCHYDDPDLHTNKYLIRICSIISTLLVQM